MVEYHTLPGKEQARGTHPSNDETHQHRIAGQNLRIDLLWLNTGATDSLVPSDELEKLGIRKEGKMSYELADGTVKEYSFGLARIKIMGETTAGR